MPRIIDPKTVSELDATNLFYFFQDEQKLGHKEWKTGDVYTFQDKSEFTFRYNVFQRAREGKEGVRYEFRSDCVIGKGMNGCRVYKIASTMAINEETMSVRFKHYGSKRSEHEGSSKPAKKKRIVKVQQHIEESHPIGSVYREYELSKMAGHLSIKPPTIVGSTSYLVMKKVKGVELYDIVAKDLDLTAILTLEQRLELTQALLRVLKERVTDKGMIHRDVKCENFIVDMESQPIAVEIIDFGFSDLADSPRSDGAGCMPFAPPELFANGLKTPKIDVFAIARVIALLWCIDTSSYEIKDVEIAAANASNVDLATLFSGLHDLSDINKRIIRTTLADMLKANSSERISLDEAIARFATVKLRDAPSLFHQLASSGLLFFRTRVPMPEKVGAMAVRSESLSSSSSSSL